MKLWVSLKLQASVKFSVSLKPQVSITLYVSLKFPVSLIFLEWFPLKHWASLGFQVLVEFLIFLEALGSAKKASGFARSFRLPLKIWTEASDISQTSVLLKFDVSMKPGVLSSPLAFLRGFDI